jgi:hypothetical protein
MPSGHLREGGALPYTLTTLQLLNGLGREPIFERREEELVPVLVSRLELLE